jgi:hypothetical protein
MQLHLSILAVLLPILLIEWPYIQSNFDMGVSGTYDVLLFSFLLPREQVLKLLPANLLDNLLTAPEDVLNTLAASQGVLTGDTHPVIVQMGYQSGTGPGPDWLPKMSFNECKVEIPYVQHPQGELEEPYVFKQHL